MAATTKTKKAGTPASNSPTTNGKTSTQSEADKIHQSVIESLRAKCLEVEFTVHDLPKSRRISGKIAEQVATAVGGKTRGIRASWSMFTSSHPAVRELNAAVRDLIALRDEWTIVRSAEVSKGDSDRVMIEGGKRLIPVEEHEEFYKLFVIKAKLIDQAAAKVQHAMDNETTGYDEKQNLVTIKSIKAVDRENAGDAWDESAYPKDIGQTVGVSKERDPNGNVVLDEDDNPKYIIAFEEYHVSEKLSEQLQKRAYERLDSKLSATVETAMGYVVGELTDGLTTFMGELTTRIGVFPAMGSEFAYLTEHGNAEVVKTLTRDQAPDKVPPDHVMVLIRYLPQKDGLKETKWLGPFKIADYQSKLRPNSTGEKKKIYPTVIEGIIAQMQAFRDKKAKMLGKYGEKLIEAFTPLLAELTKHKGLHASNEDAAKKLASSLKSNEEHRETIAKAIADTVEQLEAQVEVVKTAVTRRKTIKASLIGIES